MGPSPIDRKVPNRWIENSPAAALFGEDQKTYCFFQGGDSLIWFTRFNGSTWELDTNIIEPSNNRPRMKDRAAVVHFREKLYCIYVGSGDNREIWFASWPGNGNV